MPLGAPVGKQKFQPRAGSALSAAKAAPSGSIAKADPLLPSPAPSASFRALVGPTNSAITPDTQGAVGQTDLVTTLNTSVTVQDRNGITLNTVSIETFWSSGWGIECCSIPAFFTIPYGQRWITTAEADPSGTNPGLLVGVSKGQILPVAGTYYFIDVDTAGPRYADSPNLGLTRITSLFRPTFSIRTNFPLSALTFTYLTKQLCTPQDRRTPRVYPGY